MRYYFRKMAVTAALTVLFGVLVADVGAQTVVDKTVATVSDGLRVELITLSDLKWQLALQPGKPVDPPTPSDLEEVLQRVIDQRIFLLEAERLPRNAPTEAEIAAEIAKLLTYFPSTAEFERRLRAVGFSSISDDNFERIVAQRLAIEKYLDFRFRSFVVITRTDESEYFEDYYVPEFRRLNPGRVVPEIDAVRADINERLREESVAENIETFLDDARRRVEIVTLSDIGN
jgi:hypothetical protein